MKYKMTVNYSALCYFDIEADSLKDAMWKGYIKNLDFFNNYQSSINLMKNTELVVWLGDDSNTNLYMGLFQLQNRASEVLMAGKLL